MIERHFNIIRGNCVHAYVKLEFYEDVSEYEINDLFEEMRQVFTQAKAGDAAPVSDPSGADNA